MPIIVPEFVPYLLAILGLLIVWQIHQMQVVAGRIQATSVWDKSGIRMFIHATPNDDQTCPACREANGVAVLPSLAAKKNYSPIHGACTNPAGCRCQMIGLYGGWAQAQRLLAQLRSRAQSNRIKLPEDKFAALITGPWEKAPRAHLDRISMHMLEAMQAESHDPRTALAKYQIVIDQAKAPRDLPFVTPAYMRMIDLLERSERQQEALSLIGQVEKLGGEKPKGPKSLTAAQLEDLSLRKTRLQAALPRAS